MNSTSRLSKISIAAALAGGLFVSVQASACDFESFWTLGGSVAPGDATSPVRYVGECGFVADAVGDVVTHDIPAGTNHIKASFYAFTNGSATIFDVTGGGAFNLSVSDTTATLTVPGGGALSRPIGGTNYNGWNHYVVEWNPGTGSSLTVNGGTPATGGATASTVSTARFGYISGSLTDNMVLDQYVLASNEAVATAETDGLFTTLCPGDANDDDFRNVTDFFQVISDGSTAIVGQPDFDGNGFLNVLDAFGLLGAGAVCP